MAKLTCSSCKTELTNPQGATKFKCPSCGKSEVVRCLHCKQLAARYTCSECGFSGPN